MIEIDTDAVRENLAADYPIVGALCGALDECRTSEALGWSEAHHRGAALAAAEGERDALRAALERNSAQSCRAQPTEKGKHERRLHGRGGLARREIEHASQHGEARHPRRDRPARRTAPPHHLSHLREPRPRRAKRRASDGGPLAAVLVPLAQRGGSMSTNTDNRHATPFILCGGGRCWAECRCGWVSPTYPTSGQASWAWALHVREAP